MIGESTDIHKLKVEMIRNTEVVIFQYTMKAHPASAGLGARFMFIGYGERETDPWKGRRQLDFFGIAINILAAGLSVRIPETLFKTVWENGNGEWL